MEKRDFVFSLFLLSFSAAVMVESFRMPRMTEFGYGSYAAPGLVPGLVGGSLFVCAVLLLVRSLRALRKTGETSATSLQEPPMQKRALGVALGLILVYAVVLVGQIPFWLATLLFVFAFIAYFEWNPTASGRAKAIRLGTALTQAVIVAFAVTLLFERIFRVTLPG